MSIWLLLFIMFVLANLPWVNSRWFLFIPLKNGKNAWQKVFEVLVYYVMSLMVAMAFEQQFSGDIYPQQWEFFVTTLSLFLVFSTPGVVYRYQWLPIQKNSVNNRRNAPI